MCDKCGCTNPEKLQNKPEQCTPEQLAECHPEAKDHPCEETKQDE
jgi:hypothetical protein